MADDVRYVSVTNFIKQNHVTDVPLLLHAVTPARRVGTLNRTALRHRSI